MMLTQASEFQTPLHFVPAWVKFLGFFALSIILVRFSGVGFQALFLAGLFGVYLSFGVDFLRAGLWALKPLLYFVAFILIWNWAFDDGERGLQLALRLVNLFALANLVSLTTPLGDMLELFERILRPLRRFGLPTRSIALALALVLRFIPVLRLKSDLLMQSWRARSLKRGSWKIVVPMALLALDDASQIAQALRARGGVNESFDDE